MSNLRILGLVVGIAGLFLTVLVYRGPRWKRGRFLLLGLSSLCLAAVSVNPDILNTIGETFSLPSGPHRGRLLLLLVGSVVVLWFLVLYFKGKLDELRHQFDELVRVLGREKARNTSQKELSDKPIVVVIPAYNEAENLRELLGDMPGTVREREIGVIVVDDGSSDETSRVVREAGYLAIENRIHRGGGAALRLAYDILMNVEPEIVVTMDADGQHRPQEIECLVEPLLQGRYELVIGSRILGRTEEHNRLRFVGLRLFNFIINRLLGTRISDCSSGFRAFRFELLKAVTLREDQYHTSELIIDAAKKGSRIGEVPVTILERKHGWSKKGRDWKYGLRFAQAIVKTWWR